MPKPVTKTLTLTGATAAQSGWIVVDTRTSDVQVSYAVEYAGAGVTPVVNVQATMQDLLVSASVPASKAFAIASAAAASANGTRIAGGLTYVVNGLRVASISGGSGASTLTLSVVQSGR